MRAVFLRVIRVELAGTVAAEGILSMASLQTFAALLALTVSLAASGCAAEADAPPAYESAHEGAPVTAEDVKHARAELAVTRKALEEAADFSAKAALDTELTAHLVAHRDAVDELDSEAAALERVVGSGLSSRSLSTLG